MQAMKVGKLFSKKTPLLKMNLVISNYTTENAQERLRPNPDLCKFILPAELASLSKEDSGLTCRTHRFYVQQLCA